ncbi:MAG: hypothetical protein P4L53_11450 [Candidatus Obscuribacterales bacterium]|nr:hypothetical protein [Candidatus Obscuribacterales bacterium]
MVVNCHKHDPANLKVLLDLIGDNHAGFNAAKVESFLQLSIPAIDSKQTTETTYVIRAVM